MPGGRVPNIETAYLGDLLRRTGEGGGEGGGVGGGGVGSASRLMSSSCGLAYAVRLLKRDELVGMDDDGLLATGRIDRFDADFLAVGPGDLADAERTGGLRI